MEQIVIGMDGSEDAAVALRWAVDEAALRGARVVAVRAWSFLAQEPPFDPDYGQDKAEAALAAEIVAAVGEDAAGAIGARAVLDLPVRALLEASTDAALLVVGARGTGGFMGLRLGSVSQQVVYGTTVPVAVVRRTETAPAGRIVVGVDGSADSERALRWAIEAGRLRGAEVQVVYGSDPAVLADNPYVPAADPADQEAEARSLIDAAVEGADTSGLERPVRRTVSPRSAARAVLEAAEGADLVVVGSRGRGRIRSLILGSTSQQVVAHAPCTVVVLPAVE